MSFRNFVGAALALCIAQPVTAQTIGLDCPQLADESAYPSSFRYLAPLSVDPETGWVLRNQDIVDRIEFSDEAVALMSKLVEMLKKSSDTELVIVVPPLRGMYAPNSPDANAITAAYEHVTRQIISTGAVVADVTGALAEDERAQEEYFFRSDSHWTPQGARLTAEAVGKALLEAGTFPPAPDTPIFVTTGDILSGQRRGAFTRAIEEICGVDLQGEPNLLPVVVLASEGDMASALFDDEQITAAPEVVAVGTSFSAIDQLGWTDSLRLVLQRDVENYSVVGGGFESAIIAYAENTKPNERASILIWEFMPYYIMPYLGTRMRAILGSVLGQCAEGAEVEVSSLALTSGEASASTIVPAGHDLVQLTVPGMELGEVRFELTAPDGGRVRGAIQRRDRVESELRSDTWSFYVSSVTASGIVPHGGEIAFSIEGVEGEVVGTLKSCRSWDLAD